MGCNLDTVIIRLKCIKNYFFKYFNTCSCQERCSSVSVFIVSQTGTNIRIRVVSTNLSTHISYFDKLRPFYVVFNTWFLK